MAKHPSTDHHHQAAAHHHYQAAHHHEQGEHDEAAQVDKTCIVARVAGLA